MRFGPVLDACVPSVGPVLDTDEQAITLRSKFDGQTLCMTNTGKYVRGETACSSNSDSGLPWMAQWNFLPVG